MAAAHLADMLGVPLATASVSGPAVPVLTVQVCLVVGFRSSKINVPTVRAALRETVRLADRFRVLKSAAASVPLAITEPFQLVAVAHEPPAVLVQMPEPAGLLSNNEEGALVTPLATTV